MWQPIYRRLAYALVCLGLLGLPGAATSALAANISIYGWVTDEQGTPLDHLQVTAYVFQEGRGWLSEQVTYTSPGGNYSFSPYLSAGQYKIGFGDPELDFPEIEFFDNVATLAEAKIITNAPNSSSVQVDAQLATPTARIHGVVIDEAGKPLDQVSVFADRKSPTNTWSSIALATSDSTGAYTLTGLPAGTYRVSFYASSYRGIYYDRAPTLLTAKSIEVRRGGSVDQINARFVRHSGSLQGRVTDERGQSLGNIQVQVFEDFARDGQWQQYAFGQTEDTTGQYQIVDLMDGDYRLFFNPPLVDRWGRLNCGNLRHAAAYYPNTSTITNAQTITIKQGQAVSNLNTQLAEAGRVRGRVMGRDGVPVADVIVSTYSYKPNGTDVCMDTHTDAAGFYDLGLPAGIHRLGFFTYSPISMAPPDYQRYARYAPQYYQQGSNRTGVTPIDVRNHAIITGVDAQLELAGAMVGQIVDQNDNSLAQIKVTAYSNLGNNGLWEATSWGWSDDTGLYIVPNLSEGAYRLEFQDARQPPLFHTRSYQPAITTTVYPEEGSDLIVRVSSDGKREIVFPSRIQLVPFNEFNAGPLARYDRILVFSTTVTNTLVAGHSVLANDRDAERDPLTATLVSGPTQGTLSLAASGFFTYTPSAGALISDTFTYRANDGLHDSNVVSVTIRLGVERSFLPVVGR